ncbi:MAG: diaminopimelate decarboxylase, partial [Chitinophagaceae bacterium]
MQQLNNEQLIQAAKLFGTPIYVYHSEKITEQYQKLKTAFHKPNTKIFYACKALTNINILKHIKSIGAGIDCSSINEVKLAVYAGFEPKNILYTSNGIAFDEIEDAKNLGVNITIDSLSNLEKFGQTFGNSYPLSLRIRPNIMGGGNIQISTGHDESKFGIPVTQLQEILNIVKQTNANIEGLHIHTGSDISDIDVFIKGIEVLFEMIHHFPNLKFLDLGSGFKVRYKDGDKATDINLLAQKIYEDFENHPAAKDLEIWFEPGKFLVSECGYFLTKVNVIKHNEEATFVGVDTGFNHLIRPMFYNSYHTIKNISNPNGTQKEYAITGNLCETDTFAWQRKMSETKEGDLLCFYNAGAYGFEMSSNFNSRFKPAEV